MKIINLLRGAGSLTAIIALLALSHHIRAEQISPVFLSPGSPDFATSAANDPLHPAHTFPAGDADGPDIWTFDMSAYDPAFLVSTTLTLGDFCCHGDDYELFWDGASIGNTGVAVQRTWNLDVLAGSHTLEVIWLNPIAGGSWYNIEILTQPGSPVPLPAAAWLFIGALGGLGVAKRRR